MDNRTCTIDGCCGKHKGHGLCNKHLIRTRRHGSPDAYHPNAVRKCSISGCNGEHHARGWCVKHWNRWANTGDPEMVRPSGQGDTSGARNGRWVGDEASYTGIHLRLSRAYGKASDHSCAHCGNAANQWAYDHADPDERLSENGRPYSVAGRKHYIPLCFGCHVRFDRDNARAH